MLPEGWLVPQLRWQCLDKDGNPSIHQLSADIVQHLSVLSRDSKNDHTMAMAYIEQSYERRRKYSTDKGDRNWAWITPHDIRFATAHYTREKEKEGVRKGRLEKYLTKRKYEQLTEEADDLVDQERSGKRLKAIPKWKRKPRLFVTLKLKPEVLRNVRPRCIAVLKLSPDVLRNFPHENPVPGPSSQQRAFLRRN
ncbi:hypothetical protein H2199_005982 [Coniosporium tulheliwenetii]|uniref:Uncharacterized protein n=1 Tax=Coniosporium tulheliwenetii TaxID=3383036 RepID=A0ACC2YYC4_9PEZI|nr:hypothetical protein H2199_005982 [Cladosporium sp. JES 115]